jgi:hypothetical protein
MAISTAPKCKLERILPMFSPLWEFPQPSLVRLLYRLAN